MNTAIIRIRKRTPTGYRFELLHDVNGVITAASPVVDGIDVPEDLGLTPAELDSNGTAIDPASARRIFLDSTASEGDLAAVGRYLFRQLDRCAPWRALWERDPLIGNEELLTVLDIDSPELQSLPWELARAGAKSIFLSPELPMVRGKINYTYDRPVPRWPFKVLVVVGCEPTAAIGWQLEVAAIEAALRGLGHQAEPHVLERPSQAELVAYCTRFRPHVLHFIGHGDAALLCWSSAEQQLWSWTVDAIVNQLGKATPPLVFLNACRSAAVSPGEAQAGVFSIASAFLLAGARGVIGMQGDIPGSVAAVFSDAFYREIARHTALDVAVSAGRRAAHMSSPRRDWALPTISLAVLPGRVLPIDWSISPMFTPPLRDAPEFVLIQRFVDRRDQRGKLRLRLDTGETPAIDSDEATKAEPGSPHLLVVRGDPGVGKTMLVYWSLAHCAQRGYLHAYVDLKDADPVQRPDVLALLRLIRDGKKKLPHEVDEPSPLRTSLRVRKQSFDKFNRDLGWILQGRQPPVEDPVAPEEDPMGPLDWDKALREPVHAIFTSFRAALARAAADGPLVLAIDHFARTCTDGTQQYLRPQLFDAVSAGAIAGVRMILIVTPTEYKALDLANIRPSPTLVEVRNFQPAELEHVAKEFCGPQPGTTASKLLVDLCQAMPTEVAPSWLDWLDRTLKPFPGSRP
jgi:hypothetical protein